MRPLEALQNPFTCGRCGFENEITFRCCVQCGEWLEPDATAASGSRAGPGRTGTNGTAPRKGGALPARSSRSSRLLRLLPDGGVEEYRLDGERVEIGRGPASVPNYLPVEGDPFLSGRHAAVVRKEGRFWLSDLGSTNGTLVRLRGEWELRPGDHILIGGSLFKYVV